MSSPKTLITGAASGIGKALAERLAGDGHALVLVDRAALDHVLPKAAHLSRYVGDISDEHFWEQIAPALKGLSHAVVNAGVSGNCMLDTLDFDEWRRILSINLDGAFLTLRAAVRAIKASSGPRAIVLTSSVSGIKAEPEIGAYAASKAGVIQLARVAAKELAGDRIRVNAIAPGGVDTALWDQMAFFEDLVVTHGSRETAIDALAKMATPLGRYARADEIAAQIVFLLSEGASTITGSVLTSDGGYSL